MRLIGGDQVLSQVELPLSMLSAKEQHIQITKHLGRH